MVLLSLTKPGGPVVAGAATVLGDEDVFFVEERAVRALVGQFVHDAGFQVDEEGAGNVVQVVALVKKDVFAVVDEFGGRVRLGQVGVGAGVSIRWKLFEQAIGLDSMFEAELLPEFTSDLIAALAYLERDDFAWHAADEDGGWWDE